MSHDLPGQPEKRRGTSKRQPSTDRLPRVIHKKVKKVKYPICALFVKIVISENFESLFKRQKRCKLYELAVPRPLLPSYEVDHHRSDVINLWPGNSCSPFRSKNEKKWCTPPHGTFGFFGRHFFWAKNFANRPRGGNATRSTRATRKKVGYKQTPALDWSTTPSY